MISQELLDSKKYVRGETFQHLSSLLKSKHVVSNIEPHRIYS